MITQRLAPAIKQAYLAKIEALVIEDYRKSKLVATSAVAELNVPRRVPAGSGIGRIRLARKKGIPTLGSFELILPRGDRLWVTPRKGHRLLAFAPA